MRTKNRPKPASCWITADTRNRLPYSACKPEIGLGLGGAGGSACVRADRPHALPKRRKGGKGFSLYFFCLAPGARRSGAFLPYLAPGARRSGAWSLGARRSGARSGLVLFDHVNRNLHRYIPMQPDRRLIVAELLDRLLQIHLAPVDRVSLLFERRRNISRRHRS